jgi:VanZ family protein
VLSIVYMRFLFYLSSSPVAIRQPSISFFDKLVHMGAYGVLASLVYLTLRARNRKGSHALILAFVIATAYGLFNEIRQSLIPWREADAMDAVANGIGALLFPLALHVGHRIGRPLWKPGEDPPS